MEAIVEVQDPVAQLATTQRNEDKARPDSLRELSIAELFAVSGGTATNTYF